MEFWEFLLQQEGDQSWLPLDTAQVEILEGRYRIMAHSSQAHAAVSVQISQTLGDHGLGKRRSLSRTGQTNGEGLMVVLPFTRLAAGTWDIRCLGQAPNPTGEPPLDWAYAIQLRVLPQGAGEDGDWFADEGSLTTVPSPEPYPNPSVDRAVAPSLDLSQVGGAIDRFQAQLGAETPVNGWGYRLSLSQTALVGQAGQVIPLVGEVSGGGSVTTPLALVVRLINPETATPVGLTPFEWTAPSLPAALNLAVTLPTTPATRLLLGELVLVGEVDQGLMVLALQRFTVTVDLSLLLDAIAKQAETDTDIDLTLRAETSETPTVEDPGVTRSSINLPPAPPRALPSLTLPRHRSTLPPKIYYPSAHEAQAHRPSLPPLAPDPLPADSPRTEGNPADPPPPQADPAPALSLPPLPSAQPQPVQAPIDNSNFPAPTLAGVRPIPPGQAPQLPSHEAMGFRNLRLEERFWHRLNDLAVTLQQEAIAQRSQAVAPEIPVSQEPAQPLPFAGEVVIYEDEADLLEGPPPTPPGASELEARVPPLPHLELPPGDWVAGQPVVVRLRVPFHPSRLALKVWFTDPQTRHLVEDPRQITQLSPNGQGELEGSVQLTLPHGYLEVDLEAIAIDLHTQREGYKVSQRRSITPVDLGAIAAWSPDPWGDQGQ